MRSRVTLIGPNATVWRPPNYRGQSIVAVRASRYVAQRHAISVRVVTFLEINWQRRNFNVLLFFWKVQIIENWDGAFSLPPETCDPDDAQSCCPVRKPDFPDTNELHENSPKTTEKRFIRKKNVDGILAYNFVIPDLIRRSRTVMIWRTPIL